MALTSFIKLATALGLASYALAQSGDFNVLTMNVAGLPAVLQGNDVPGDKTENTRQVGRLFSQYRYDVINVQEDFNYHAALYETDNHPYRTSTSGGVPFGDGMNTLSNFPWIDFSRTKWDVCSQASSNDCLTPKGFSFMRVQIAEGVYIDVVNLHADAGVEPGDLDARARNLRQVSAFLRVWSIGNAVIIFGDTNSRYTRTADVPFVFDDDNGMKDAFVELQRGGVRPTQEITCANPSYDNNCETVDKVFYRGSRSLTLQATSFRYDSPNFLQADGVSVFTDHNPVLVNFTYSVGNQFRQSDYFGGPHGTWFNDLDALPGSPKTSVITFRGSERIDSVGLTLRSGETLRHGGNGGNRVSLALADNEFWVGAVMCSGQRSGETRVSYIQATTSSGRTLESGRRTSNCVTYNAPNAWQIVGLMGRQGDEIDQLALIYAPR